MENVMLDLETLAVDPHAIILSIGAATFGDGVGHTMHVVPDLVEQDRLGRTIDPNTVLFWMRQSQEARQVFEVGKTPVRESLLKLADFIERNTTGFSKVKVWSNGADFDLVLLKTLYESLNMVPPWRFYNHRCFRTLKELYPEDYKTAQTKIKRVAHHNAEDDARWQAAVAVHILKRKAAQAKVIDNLEALSNPEGEFSCIADGQEKDDLTKSWWDYDRI